MPAAASVGEYTVSPTSSPPTPSWKSIFRIANQSSKKLPAHDVSNLTLDTHSIQTPLTQTPALTPNSITSVDARFSSNSLSSSTQSSGSNSNPNSTSSRPGPSGGTMTPAFSTQQLWSPDTHPPPPLNNKASRNKLKQKQEKQRALGKTPQKIQALSASQQTFGVAATRSAAPMSPKSVGSSATRFIRRVASAPNAKGLFAIGARSTSATTKNGLLSPGEMPPIPGHGSDHTNSLETESSVSSVDPQRPRKPVRANSTAGLPVKSKDRITSLNSGLEGPGKVAFRRTYSSHSIKVRSVEVNPSSFQKIKMLGRGDVGKVYLVREKKSGKLFAMKGPSAFYTKWHFTRLTDMSSFIEN